MVYERAAISHLAVRLSLLNRVFQTSPLLSAVDLFLRVYLWCLFPHLLASLRDRMMTPSITVLTYKSVDSGPWTWGSVSVQLMNELPTGVSGEPSGINSSAPRFSTNIGESSYSAYTYRPRLLISGPLVLRIWCLNVAICNPYSALKPSNLRSPNEAAEEGFPPRSTRFPNPVRSNPGSAFFLVQDQITRPSMVPNIATSTPSTFHCWPNITRRPRCAVS
ncbi:hypothetical protein BV25DRAFT_942066 [Artomyces pyxidatus]|uniref:Uncharacterized protein n=1 Tax=Artomyces pyxidatus TaxID=48021 RepID=A0ACB8SW00_9AGAM|nr:hypothetical protein BV25DRAFT_942066 [Artomyces pyxidatus]